MAADRAPWLVITNPRSGGGDDFDLFAAARYAQHRLHRPIRVFQLNRRSDVGAEIRAALADGCRRVIVRGGDGTLRSAGEQLAGTGAEFGVLPGGTFNHFAKNLGVPSDTQTAWEVALGDRVTTIDVGEVNGRVFLNNASLGIYPLLVIRRPPWSGRLGKFLAGAVALVRTAHHFVAPRLVLAAEGARTEGVFSAVFIGNNRYAGEDITEFWRRPVMTEGVLDVHVVPGDLARRAALWVMSMFGAARVPALQSEFAAPELEIRSLRIGLTIALDGETMQLTAPLRFRSRPGALRVVAPPGRDEPHVRVHRPAGRSSDDILAPEFHAV